MARMPSDQSRRWRRAARLLVPPAATAALSVAMLWGALWVRNQEHPLQLGVRAASDAAYPPAGNSAGTNQALSAPHAAGKAQSPASDHDTKLASRASQTGSGSHPIRSPKAPAKQTPPHTTTTHATSDVGFTPVSGGTVTALTGQLPQSSTLLFSTVSQFGAHPVTTWQAASVPGPKQTSLTLPTGVPASDFLVLPLASGVLWAQVPQTQIGPTGTLGPSASATVLYYTPFPVSGSQPLTTHAHTLGSIPATASGLDSSVLGGQTADPAANPVPPLFWYTADGQSSPSSPSSPGPAAAGQGSGNSTSKSAASSTVIPGNSAGQVDPGPGSVSTGTTGGGSAGLAPSSSTSADLYLAGMYQTSQGAVIALQAQSTGDTGSTQTWLYDWRESSAQLTPITVLTNGQGTYAWFAIGEKALYFGTRSVIPPSSSSFRGRQYLYDTATLHLTPIRLGTWTSTAYTAGNTLVFEVRDTSAWESFTPDGQL